jgi:hypothetical protein
VQIHEIQVRLGIEPWQQFPSFSSLPSIVNALLLFFLTFFSVFRSAIRPAGVFTCGVIDLFFPQIGITIRSTGSQLPLHIEMEPSKPSTLTSTHVIKTLLRAKCVPEL